MQCLITSDLSLVIEVHKVVMKYGDVEPVRCLGVTRSCSPIRTLEGWSTINLGATYALSNVMDGQPYTFNKLRIFETARLDRKLKISDQYQKINKDMIGVNSTSAFLTQFINLSGSFSFDVDYHKAKN